MRVNQDKINIYLLFKKIIKFSNNDIFKSKTIMLLGIVLDLLMKLKGFPLSNIFPIILLLKLN